MIDVLNYEYNRRLKHVIEELGGKILRGFRYEVPAHHQQLARERVRQIQEDMQKPPLVQDLKIMLGDHPEWMVAYVVDGRLMLYTQEEIECSTSESSSRPTKVKARRTTSRPKRRPATSSGS